MRFEFCNKLDCPDWILAQLAHASKLDLQTFEQICIMVKRSMAAGGNNFNQQDLMSLLVNHGAEVSSLEEMEKEVKEEERTKEFDIDDARACFGAVNFIITNAHSYKVSMRQLNTELEQLGLPSEHCQTLCTVTSNEANLHNK